MKCRSIGTGVAGFVALLVTCFAAQSADIVRKAPSYQPAPSYSWTGFYVGAVAGFASGTSQHVVPLTSGSPLAGLNASDPFKVSGSVFGVTIGYNYQINNWVVGIEGDYSLSTKSGVHGSSISLLNPLFTVSTSEQSLATLRGRLGYAFDRFLVYGTFGAAMAKVKAEDTSLLSTASDTQTMMGWAGGAGIEYAVFGNWSLKAEYLHVDLGSKTFFNPNPNLLGVPHSVSLTNNLYRVGLNYKFGGPVYSRF